MWPFKKTDDRTSRPPAASNATRRVAPNRTHRTQIRQQAVPEFSVEDRAASNDGASMAPEVPFRGNPEPGRAGALGSSGSLRAAEFDHIATYGGVPKFISVLSAGDKPIVELTRQEKERVAVIELAGRKALVVHAQLETTLLDSITGTLRANKFGLAIATADAAVISEIYSAGVKTETGSGSGRKKTEFMQSVNEWISYAVRNRATDVHLEVLGSKGVVRFRVDGQMEHMRADHEGRYTSTFIERCMASLFNNDQMAKSGSDSMFEKDQFLYCMVPYNEVPGHTLKLRYQSIKGNEGPKVVLRLLHVDENLPTLGFEELGYAPSQIKLWKQAMDTPSGMVAIAGVTGSGKSTTLKSFIELNPNTPSSNVLTIEDPVEYPIRGAHQVPVQRDLSNPEESSRRFSEAISAFMRGDPDVVMVGEIRDRFSANAAQQLAETGHMALGTVHAHLLSGIVPRLVNSEIGMTRQILTAPNMVTLFAYQALVPKLCPQCSQTTEQAIGDWRINDIAENVKKLRLDPTRLRWKRVGGCSHCNGRGTLGLGVVAEMLMPDEEWLRPIREGLDTEAVHVYRSRSNRDLMDEDMTGKSVFEHTLYKALHGQVDARQCSAFDTWHRFMQHHSNADRK